MPRMPVPARPRPTSTSPTRRGPALFVVLFACSLVAGVTVWATGRDLAGFGPFQQAFAAAIVIWGLLIGYATWCRHVGARLLLGTVGLAVPPAIFIAEQLGHDAGILAGERGPVSAVFAGVCLLTILGIARHRLWAWWLACAGAVVGGLSSGLNGIGSLANPGLATWATATIFGGVCLALVGLLAGDVRRTFRDGAHTNPVWQTSDPVIVALRWTIGANLVALPMLLVYAWTQPVVPATATPALVLAALLTVSEILAVARKLVGALLLCLTGLALLALTATTLACAPDPEARYIAAYYTVFWTPAGLLSAWTGARILGRIGRLLRT